MLISYLSRDVILTQLIHRASLSEGLRLRGAPYLVIPLTAYSQPLAPS